MKNTIFLFILTLFFLAGQSPVRALASDEAEQIYKSGQDALNVGHYPAAVESFSRLVAQSKDQLDRALYWQAYAFHKANRKKEALNALRRLIGEFPQSPWRDDAEVLRLEIEGVRDHEVDQEDEELKLYALEALQQVEPEKAAILLEKFIRGEHSLKLKEHALFILGQIDSERGATLLLEIARGTRGAHLQLEAIRALGASGEDTAIKVLSELYRGNPSGNVKSAIIDGLIAADGANALAEIAKLEKDRKIQEHAFRSLGAVGASPQLRELAKTMPLELMPAILEGLGIAGETDFILEILRSSRDEKVKAAAIRALTLSGDEDQSTEIAADLEKLYPSAGREIKQAIIQALGHGENAEALLKIFRSEKDRDLKREAFQWLTQIESPESEKLIEDLLNG
jgi:HEAT repeat protein